MLIVHLVTAQVCSDQHEAQKCPRTKEKLPVDLKVLYLFFLALVGRLAFLMVWHKAFWWEHGPAPWWVSGQDGWWVCALDDWSACVWASSPGDWLPL